MKKILAIVTVLLPILAAACSPAEKPAPKPPTPEARQVVVDKLAALDAIREGDQADVLDTLQTLAKDRAGWASGGYDDFYRPMWELYVRVSAPGPQPANAELRTALSNFFNLGNWYPLLGDFLAALKDPAAPLPVRQAAAEHLWRFAGKDKAGQGFTIPAADRPLIEAAAARLLKETDLGLLSTAAATAWSLNLKSAAPRLKEIAAGQSSETSEARAFRFSLGEALFGLGEPGAAADVMRKLTGSKGDFSEEAGDFLKEKHLK